MANLRPDILTSTGRYFDFIQPNKSMVNILDIAQGLSNTCRFAGQCNKFYSVAEHSVYVSNIVPKELALVGLLHDASEAYLGDVTAPLKRLLGDYKVIEERVHKVIFESFGINPTMPPEIKHADLQMLAREQLILMPQHDDEWALIAGIKPAELRFLFCYNPIQAKQVFLSRFYELTQNMEQT